VVAAGVVPVSVGGDHSIALPILKAVGGGRPVGMVHIDAHGDTGDDYMGSRFHHGAPFRRAVEAGVLDPTRVIQIGLRGTSTVAGSLWAFSEESGMRVMPMDEVHDRGWAWAVEEAHRVVGAGPAYLSFDIDSLDPAFAPGTGTPEAGGLSTIEALRMVRGMRGIDFVGADLVEVSPPFDVGGLTAFHGASVLFEVLCVVAAARVARGGCGAQGA
jgi:guanidinopropionase